VERTKKKSSDNPWGNDFEFSRDTYLVPFVDYCEESGEVIGEQEMESLMKVR